MGSGLTVMQRKHIKAKEAVGGKSQSRCDGAAQIAVNIRYGVSYLTQVTVTNHNREVENQAIEAARDKTSAAHEDNALADVHVDEAKAETTELARKFGELKKKVFSMWQSDQAGPSTAPFSVLQLEYHDFNNQE
ncbi:hypothetical protein KIW84_075251 [Lathyrus oleraceus]|uniref:Uncharacterized protein n=1 Tax=Pisum sativum TaxID=3888 RepID=A0A9D4ZZ67_PEA|nr:hypothetical protein KIW84_075251 [Pisum sativum]